jgi:hypothetical protein
VLKTGENKEIFIDEFKKSEFFQQKTDNFPCPSPLIDPGRIYIKSG